MNKVKICFYLIDTPGGDAEKIIAAPECLEPKEVSERARRFLRSPLVMKSPLARLLLLFIPISCRKIGRDQALSNFPQLKSLDKRKWEGGEVWAAWNVSVGEEIFHSLFPV
jgi:hypothetical protein